MTELTAEELRMMHGDRFLRSTLRRSRIKWFGTSYDDFVGQLYEDLDNVIFGMQATRELLQKDCEDRLSSSIIQGLKMVGYDAVPDGKTGGHVDISVRLGDFSWIGEAKKDGNFSEGFLQLITRYVPASGNYSHNHGGLIFYMVSSPDAKGRLESWRDEISSQGSICTPCPRNVLAFFSEHVLEGSGTHFKVRTMAVSLYHKPKDKSARTSAAKKAKNAARVGAAG